MTKYEQSIKVLQEFFATQKFKANNSRLTAVKIEENRKADNIKDAIRLLEEYDVKD